MDPTGSMLTTKHSILVELALATRVLEPALPVLDKFILYFPGATNVPKPNYLCQADLPPTAFITAGNEYTEKFKYQTVLEYFLYSGMVYIALGRWESALESLESAITYPVKESSVSKIMVEAYKKWILVGLLLEGQSSRITQVHQQCCRKSLSRYRQAL